MKEQLSSSAPCSSRALESAIRVATASAICGLCKGFLAGKTGLTGVARFCFVANSASKLGLLNGCTAAAESMTCCRLERYREKNDWKKYSSCRFTLWGNRQCNNTNHPKVY